MSKIHFEENSVITCTPSQMPRIAMQCPKIVTDIGKAVASAVSAMGKVCVGYGEGRAALALGRAFSAGVCSVGVQAVEVGMSTVPSLAYAVKRLGCSVGAYISANNTVSVRLFSADGAKLTREEEDRIECRLNVPAEELPLAQYGEISFCEGISEVYLSRLAEIVTGRLERIYAQFYSPTRKIVTDAQRLIAGKNGTDDDTRTERIAFHISGDGSKVSAYSEPTGYVLHDRLMAVVTPNVSNSSVTYGDTFPFRERFIPDTKSPLACDGTALALTVLEILRNRGITLKEATDELPDYAVAERYIPLDKPYNVMKKLNTNDGVLMDGESGRVVIRPNRTGRGIMLRVESFAAETAAELCDFYAEMLSDNSE
ncbi:MAG: hypothetical protein LIO69_07820 [Oscillospiraceae bacterium]|nr:hypothetical protein [Oscillospiraceae bacterium]